MLSLSSRPAARESRRGDDIVRDDVLVGERESRPIQEPASLTRGHTKGVRGEEKPNA